MKTLHLTLAKELLIVEVPTGLLIQEDDWYMDDCNMIRQSVIEYDEDYWNRRPDYIKIPNCLISMIKDLNFTCKATDLTEDIAEELVHKSIHTGLFAHYVKDIPVNTYCYKSALDSFKSAIEANGFHWGRNPYQNDWDELCEWGYVAIDGKTCSKSDRYEKAKNKTFNLKQTLIFEKI